MEQIFSLNLEHKLERQRKQYFAIPFVSFILSLIVMFAIALPSSFKTNIAPSDKRESSFSSLQTSAPTKKEANAKDLFEAPNEIKPLLSVYSKQDSHTEKKNGSKAVFYILHKAQSYHLILPITIFITLFYMFTMSWSVIFTLTQSLLALVIILFTKKYPRFLFTWQKYILSYYFNINAYCFLMLDKFPSVHDDELPLKMDIPDATELELSRLMPFVKWLLTIIQHISISLLKILVTVINIFLWFYLIFTGNPYPKRMQEFIIGLLEWELAVVSYSMTLTTDKYPGFTFKSKNI